MGSGRGCSLEAVSRACRTVYFMVIMIASSLLSSAPLFVSIVDIVTPCILLSTFSCCRTCFHFKQDREPYSFRTSLVDIPFISLVRSLAIFCAYTICGIPTLTYGPYLATAAVCGFVSTTLLVVKASLFSLPESSPFAPASGLGPLHLRHTWEMPSLFLSSMFLALGHIVVAYRTRCQARRKLHFYRADQEAVPVCKAVFNGYHKSPRSSFQAGKFNKSSLSGGKLYSNDDSDVPARMLADKDSFFMVCGGLLVHYKFSENFRILISGQIASKLSSDVGEKQHFTMNYGSRKFESTLSSSAKDYESISNDSSNIHTPLLRNSVPDSEYSANFSGIMAPESLPKSSRTGEKVDQQAFSKGVVLIHGFGGGVFSWRHIMHSLATQVGCPVVAFDRPGWGLTSRPRRAEWEMQGLSNPYEFHSQVDLLFSFCQDLNLTSVVLVGHDDGGLLALMAAARSRTLKDMQVEVKGVVLLGASLSREVMPTFARVLLHTSLGRHMLRPLLRSEIGQVANRRCWHDSSKLTSDVLDLYKVPLRVEGWDKALAEVSKTSTGVLTSNNAAEVLKPVYDMPALVVAGVQDSLVPLKSVQALAEQLPHSRLVAIPSCGHLPHEESPRALLAALIPFIHSLQNNDGASVY